MVGADVSSGCGRAQGDRGKAPTRGSPLLRAGLAGRSNGPLAPQVVQRDMTSEPVRAVRALEGRLDLFADTTELARAAGVKAAAGRWATGARHSALEPDRGRPRGRIEHR